MLQRVAGDGVEVHQRAGSAGDLRFQRQEGVEQFTAVRPLAKGAPHS